MGACRNVSQCQNVNKRTRFRTQIHTPTQTHTSTHTHEPRLAKSISTIQRENHPLGYLRQATLVYCLGSTHVHIVIYRVRLVSAQLSAHILMSIYYLCMYVCVYARNVHVFVSNTYYLLYYKIIRAFSSVFGFIFVLFLFIL